MGKWVRPTSRGAIALGVAFALGSSVAPQAGAAQTLGHAFFASGGIGCAGNVTYVQPTDGTYGYAAPRDGVITSWTTLGYWDSMKLKIFRPASPSSYTVVAQDGPRPQVFAETNTFAVRIPVRQGDIIGTYTPSSGFCPGGPNGTHNVGTSAGDPAVGSNAFFTNQYTGTVPIEANFEDDVDGDGYGDETQDGCPTNGTTHGPCPLPTTLGQTLTPYSGGQSCVGGTRVVTASPGIVSAAPQDGVITSWGHKTQANVGTGTIRLKMLRPLGGTGYRTIGESSPQTPAPNKLNTYPVRIPVREGDRLGLAINGTVPCSQFTAPGSYARVPQDLPSGSSATFGSDSNGALDISARLEADADGDGYGDTSQDRCPTDPATQGTCPVKPPPSDAACDKAKEKLAKAKAKLKKLKKNDAPAKKVKKAKKKVKSAKEGVKKAC